LRVKAGSSPSKCMATRPKIVDDRRHRHQRQDLLRPLVGTSTDRVEAVKARSWARSATVFADSLTPSPNTTPDCGRAAPAIAGILGSRGAIRGDGSLLARLGAGAGQRRAFRVGRLAHQLDARPLDYHGAYGNLAAAKAGLFGWPGLKFAVLNLDDPFGVELAGKLGCSGVAGRWLHLGATRKTRTRHSRQKNCAWARPVRLRRATPWGSASLASPLLAASTRKTAGGHWRAAGQRRQTGGKPIAAPGANRAGAGAHAETRRCRQAAGGK